MRYQRPGEEQAGLCSLWQPDFPKPVMGCKSPCGSTLLDPSQSPRRTRAREQTGTAPALWAVRSLCLTQEACGCASTHETEASLLTSEVQARAHSPVCSAAPQSTEPLQDGVELAEKQEGSKKCFNLKEGLSVRGMGGHSEGTWWGWVERQQKENPRLQGSLQTA